MTRTKTKAPEPIYERLGPGECLILERTDEELLVACNDEGQVVVKKVPLPGREG